MKGLTDCDEYICDLNEELQQLGREELRESTESRAFALKLMREWILKNPRILSCRMDAIFLLRFLRAKKFSVPMAQECLERYILLRKSYNGVLFTNMNFALEPINTLINDGYLFALPKRDALGRRVIFYRPSVFYPNKYHNTQLLKMHGLAYETLLETEEDQLRGFVHIVDAAGLNLSYMTIFTPKEAMRIVKNAERTLPMRHKAIIGLNVHSSLKFAVDFALSMTSKKMRNRIHFFRSADDACKEMIDASILPEEYGGKVPMRKIIDLWKEELNKKRSTILSHDNINVNLDMYSLGARLGAVRALKKLDNDFSTQTNLNDIYGSFRKLEVD